MAFQNGGAGAAGDHLARAQLLFELDRLDEAREELGGALSADPAHVPALTLLALLELEAGNNVDALNAAQAALAAEPTHETAAWARAYALAETRQPEQAVAQAEQLRERRPGSWWHSIHYALVVSGARNGQAALDAAWEATREAPEEARTHLTLALVAGALGVEDLAERAMAAALRREPGIDAMALDSRLGPRLLRSGPEHSPTPRSEPAIANTDPDEPQLSQRWRRTLRRAAFPGIAAPFVVGFFGGDAGVARLVAVLASLGAGGVLYWQWRQLAEDMRAELGAQARADRVFGLALLLLVVAPTMVMSFALTGDPRWLAGAVFAALGALLISILRGGNGNFGRTPE